MANVCVEDQNATVKCSFEKKKTRHLRNCTYNETEDYGKILLHLRLAYILSIRLK